MLCNWSSVSVRDHPQAECAFMTSADGLPRKQNSPLPFSCPSPTPLASPDTGRNGDSADSSLPLAHPQALPGSSATCFEYLHEQLLAGTPITWEWDVLPSILLITVSSGDQVRALLGKEKEVGTILSPTWNIKKNEGTKKCFCTLTKEAAG